MKKIVIILIICLILTSFFPFLELIPKTNALDLPEIAWAKTYGSTTDNLYGISMIETSDGGYMIMSNTHLIAAGLGGDVLLIKVDSEGNEQWRQSYGGESSTGENDYGEQVIQTNDGAYAIVGYTNRFGSGGYDAWLIKVNSGGTIVWSQAYGGENHDYGKSVVQTSDRGYAIAGIKDDECFLIKTDENGNKKWNQTYSSGGHSIVQTSDGGFAIAGNGDGDVLLLKTDANGNEQWTQSYGGPRNDNCWDMIQTSDGGFVFAGSSSGDALLLKVNASGIEQWIKNYDGGLVDFCNSVVETADGGFAMIGGTSSYGSGGIDVWLIETNEIGDSEWNITIGGIGHDEGMSVVQSADEGYTLFGRTDSFSSGAYECYLVRVEEKSSNSFSLTVSVSGSGSTSPSVGTYYHEEGDTISVSAGTNEFGWRFDYWLLDSVNVGSENPISITMNEDHTLKAVFLQWAILAYTLDVSVSGFGSTSPSVGTYHISEGITMSFSAIPDFGWPFDHWLLDSVNVGSTNPISVTMDDDHTLVAVFTEPEITCTLDISVSGSGTTSPSAGTYQIADGITRSVSAYSDEGWLFDHWELDSENVGSINPISVSMNDDHTLIAVFAEVIEQHVLNVFSAHGSPSPDRVTLYESGQLVTASVDSQVIEGNMIWTCTGWTGSGSVPESGSEPIVTFNIEEDSTITWNWEGKYLTVTLIVNSPVDSSQIIPRIGEIQYNNGESITCTAPRTIQNQLIFECIGWRGTGSVPKSGSGTTTTFTITEDSSITWLWSTKDLPKLSTPEIYTVSPEDAQTKTIYIKCAQTDVDIRYTTDGSQPTVTSKLYQGPFTISSTTEIWAIAIQSGYSNSDPSYAKITIDSTEPTNFLNAPLLIFPTDNTKLDYRAVTFAWSRVDEAKGYQIKIEGPVSKTATIDTLHYSVTLSDGVYSWSVRAYNDDAFSEWALSNFRIEVQKEEIYSTGWDPTLDSYYKYWGGGGVWSPPGTCYGTSSTMLLYFKHYTGQDLSYPYFPVQSSPASYTSELVFPTSDQIGKLSNAYLSVLLHQFDPKSLVERGQFLNEASEFDKMLNSIKQKNPVLLNLLSNDDKGHSVVAWEIEKNNEIYTIKISDPKDPGEIRYATYDENKKDFTYDNGIFYDKFCVVNPQMIDISWFSSKSFFDFWTKEENLVESDKLDGYTLIVSDKKLKVTIKPRGLTALPHIVSFGSTGNSGTFTCDVMDVWGITEGNIEVIAVPNYYDYYVNDPTTDQSTTMIIRIDSESEQVVTGYLIESKSYVSSINYTLSNSGSALLLNSHDSNFHANFTLFSIGHDSLDIFKTSNIEVNQNQNLEFIVDDWNSLNSTSEASVTLNISDVYLPEKITTYNLVNGQDGLPVKDAEDLGVLLQNNIIPISIVIILVLLIVSVFLIKRRKGKNIN